MVASDVAATLPQTRFGSGGTDSSRPVPEERERDRPEGGRLSGPPGVVPKGVGEFSRPQLIVRRPFAEDGLCTAAHRASLETLVAAGVLPDSMSSESVHTIRLQGPWDAAPLGPAGTGYSRIHLPGEVERLNFGEGGFRLRRRFHKPTGLGAADRIFLVLPLPAVSVTVEVNAHRLTAEGETAGGSRWRVSMLESHNTLVVTVPDGAGDIWSRWREPVLLEIVPGEG